MFKLKFHTYQSSKTLWYLGNKTPGKPLTLTLDPWGFAQPLHIVKILTPSLFCSGVTDSLFIIFPSFFVSSSITSLTIHYWPFSVPFQSVCSLVLSINIVTLGSSSINYDFILTSCYPSNGCFTRKIGIPILFFPILSFYICFTSI